MAPKRRDNKGRVLQMGEWQEPNGRYRYIYNDALGKRKIIYSWSLATAVVKVNYGTFEVFVVPATTVTCGHE